MAHLKLAMASSHAFAFNDPATWDPLRTRIRQHYADLYGDLPPEQPQVAEETDEAVAARHPRIVDAFERVAEAMEEEQPDVLFVIGDDQNENFLADNLPQFSIHLGDSFEYKDRHSDAAGTQESDAALARFVATHLIDRGFDLALSTGMPGGALRSHAHVPILERLGTPGRTKVIPVFVNAIHVPAPQPQRCYDIGVALREAIALYGSDDKVALYASGGMSHFTAGYPWPYYSGDHTIGAIDTGFDAYLVERMAAGDGARLASLASHDLLDHGGIEFRQWLVLLGAIGGTRPEVLVYEPFHRALMGMGVGLWRPGSSDVAAADHTAPLQAVAG